jgi:photosystem II stability/assembly factor-like uncharacterized protein
MGNKVTRAHGRPHKFLATGVTVASAFALTCPAAQTAYATANQYDWIKHTSHDLKGGTYTSVASSADGSHLIVSSKDGGEGYNEASPLYISDDYGATWDNVTEVADNRIRNTWTSADISNDGQTMIAASSGGMDLDTLNGTDGKIFVSQNGGSTWEDVSPVGAQTWHAVAVSGDGDTLVAVADDDMGNLYISTDGGDSWQTDPISNVWNWESLSISDNGNKILIGGESSIDASSFVYISDDGGDNWTNVSPDQGFMVFTTRTAMSASGDKIVVSTYAYNGSGYYDQVNISEDDGAHWTDINPDDPYENQWNAIAMSDDGSTISVLDNNDKMYLTRDNGDNWTEEDPGQADDDDDGWLAIDMNSTGSRIIAASDAFAYSGYNSAFDETTSVSMNEAEGGKAVKLTLPSGTTITCHSPVKESGLSAQDGVYSYPLGLVDFCFSGADTSNEVSLIFVTALKPNEVMVRKYNPTTSAYTTLSGATVTETTYTGQHALLVTYAIADNGPLDTDPDVGEVADPVGLAVLQTGVPNTGLSRATESTTPLFVTTTAVAASLAAVPLRRKLYRSSTPKE